MKLRNTLIQAIKLSEIVSGNAYTNSDLYIKLLKISRKLSRLDTMRCNGEITDEKYDIELAKIENKLQGINDDDRLFAYHQSDPRGVSLYVSDTPIDITNYTNAIAIY